MRKILLLLMLLSATLLAQGKPIFGSSDNPSPDYYEQAVRSDFNKGEWEKGKITLDQAFKLYPSDAALNELMGRYHKHHGRLAQARYYLLRSLQDDQTNDDVRLELIDVEDKAGNYSTAIAYVNIVLEHEPYDKSLWLKRIALYRKQGNLIEADRQLERLLQIYPNDQALTEQYALRLEDQVDTGDNLTSNIDKIKRLIEINPGKEEYYLRLSNLQLQVGDENAALAAATQGLARFPGSSALLEKKIGILAQQGRFTEALAVDKEHGGAHYNSLVIEAARAANMQDPYTLYGKAYERGHSDEALTYLLNTSITRGYDEDALYYLAEAKKRRGPTLDLLMKQYTVLKRMGNTSAADGILTQLYARFPENYDVAYELATRRLMQAQPLIDLGLHGDAIPLLQQALQAARENGVREAALTRLYASSLYTKEYELADSVLEVMHRDFPQRDDYYGKKADLLVKKGDWKDALVLLSFVIDHASNSTKRLKYVNSYEEIALPAIKGLIAKGAWPAAAEETAELLKIAPYSQQGLTYGINMAQHLGQYELVDTLLATALRHYPDDLGFISKQATTLARKGKYSEALGVLRPQLNVYPGDTILTSTFSGITESAALRDMRSSHPHTAIELLDSALHFDPGNRSLLYDKGLAYEKMRMYDSAYIYQTEYRPSLIELSDFLQHLKALRYQAHNNEFGIEYMQGRYGSEDIITSVGTLSYSHFTRRNTYSLTLNYAGRDGGDKVTDQVPGGTGVQAQGGWAHVFSPRWSLDLTGAWASRYFPQIWASGTLTYTHWRGAELSLGLAYRRISTYRKDFRWDQSIFNEITNQYGSWTFDGWNKNYQNLFSASLGIAKSFERVRLSSRVDGMWLSKKAYVNGVASVRYFVLDDKETSITLSGAVGTAPEASLIDNAMPASFSHVTSMVGLAARYLLTPELAIGCQGTWNTFYSQMNAMSGSYENPNSEIITTYKNLFNIYLNLYVKF